MWPRRRKTISSKRFKCYVDAWVPPKWNTVQKPSADFHYTWTEVNLVNEMAELCRNNTLSLPATSQRSQIWTFYLKDDSPNVHDHDRNCKLVPAGYQIFCEICRIEVNLCHLHVTMYVNYVSDHCLSREWILNRYPNIELAEIKLSGDDEVHCLLKFIHQGWWKVQIPCMWINLSL